MRQILNRYLYIVGGRRASIQCRQCHSALIVDPRGEQSDYDRPADQEREGPKEVDIAEEAGVGRLTARSERSRDQRSHLSDLFVIK